MFKASRFNLNPLWLLSLAIPLLLIAIVIWHDPFFGLMDDGPNLYYARTHHGIVEWAKFICQQYVTDMHDNGRFRFFYFAMVGALYSWNAANPMMLQIASLVLATFIIIVAAKSLIRCFRFLSEPSSAEASPNDTLLTLSAVCGAWLFPFTIYWFNAPSVHEKLVVLGAACFLSILVRIAKMPYRFWLPLTAIALLVCTNTKEQIVIYYPAFVALQWGIDRKLHASHYKRTASLLAVGFAMVGLIYYIGTFGTYKQQYSSTEIMQTLSRSRSIPLFFATCFFSIYLAYRNWRRSRNLELMAFEILFVLSFPAFSLLMMPWGVGHYLNSACVFSAMLVGVQVFRTLVQVKEKRAIPLLIAMMFAGAAVSGTLYAKKLHIHSDLNRIITRAEIQNQIPVGSKVAIPGLEASATIAVYFDWFVGKKVVASPIEKADFVFLAKAWDTPARIDGFDRLVYSSQFKDGLNVWGRARAESAPIQ